MLGPLIKAIYHLAMVIEKSGNEIREALEDRALGRIEHKIDRILHHEVKVSQELDDLKREVLETKDAAQRIIDALNSIKAQLVDVQQKLADAIASNDPAALESAAQDLNTIQASIDAAVTPPTP